MRHYARAFIVLSACALIGSVQADELSISLFDAEPAAVADAAPLAFSLFDEPAALEQLDPLQFALFMPEAAGEKPAKPRAKQLLFFCALWCGPCKPVKKDVFPKLAKEGWNISDDPAAQIRVVDFDQSEALAAEHKVEELPTWVMLEHGKEVERHIGFLDPFAVGRLYTGADRQTVAYQP